jgi:Uma2 family endonuclease
MQTAEPIAKTGEPTWAIAHLFPVQGEWSEEEYLALDTNHLVEFSAGYVEVLPLPGFVHQRLVFMLQRLLWEFVTQRGLGEVLSAPLPVQLWAKKYREPDLIFITAEKRDHQPEDYVVDPDLVMEIVSPHHPDRDYEKKCQEYARAGIPEYWIVDP